MRLISCGTCGVILDGDKLDFADDSRLRMDCGSINLSLASWSHRKQDHVAMVNCPVCKSEVLDE